MPNIEELFSQANTAQQGVVSGMQASTKLPDMLKQAVSEKFKSSPIYGDREGAAKNLMDTPTSYRADMANLGQTGQAILSPTQQQALVSQARSTATVPLMTLNDILGMRTGSVNDIMNSAIGANQTDLQAQQLNADNLYRNATGAYDRDLAERKFAYDQSKSSGGLSGLDLSGLLGGQPTEQKPAYSASSLNAVSPGGEWSFNGRDWDPVQQTSTDNGSMDPLKQIIGMALLKEGKLSQAYSVLKPEKQSSARLKSADALSGIENNISQLYSLSKDLPDTKFGSFTGNIKSKIPYLGLEPDINTYQSLRKAFTGPMARVISAEVGVLTDKDIQRSQDIIPSIKDSVEQRNKKWKELLTAIENVKTGQVKSQEGKLFMNQFNQQSSGGTNSDWELLE